MMKHANTVALALLLLAAGSACGSEVGEAGGSGTSDGQADGGVPAPSTTDAEADGETLATWSTLLDHDWEIEPGQEAYYCVRKTVTEDVWISGFRGIAPAGTHHTSIGFGDPGVEDPNYMGLATSGPDGVVECNGIFTGTTLLYFGGAGNQPLEMPEGIAVKIPKGKQMLLTLHLFDVSEVPISGRSGVEVIHADPSEVVHEAQVVTVGKDVSPDLTVVPGESTQSEACTMTEDVTIFAVAAHMHLFGTHMKTTATLAGGSQVTLLDEDYDFGQQHYNVIEPSVELHAGDTIEVTCSYNNTGGATLVFGESTHDEMCITGTYRYPATSPKSFCAD